MSEIELFFGFVLSLIAGFYMGWSAATRFHLSMISEILREAGIGVQKLTEIMENLQARLPEGHPDAFPVLKIRLEKLGDQFYAFDAENGEFLGQGATENAIFEDILKTNPKQTLMVSNKIEEMK